MNGTVIVFEGEVRPDEFQQWTGSDVAHPEKYFVSDYSDLSEICSTLLNYKPDLVIVDSANMIEGAGSSSKDKVIYPQLRSIIEEVGCHCIMIAQLNQDGTIKGGTTAEHLVDIVAKVDWVSQAPSKDYERIFPNIDCFELRIIKNRYGPPGGHVEFAHERNGVRFICSSITLFNNSRALELGVGCKIIPQLGKKR